MTFSPTPRSTTGGPAAQAPARNPANAQRDVHVDYFKASRVQAAVGDLKAAFIGARKSIALCEAEVAAHPGGSEAFADLGEAYAGFGALLEKSGNLQESLQNYKKAITNKEAAAKADPANAVARGELSEDYFHAGNVSLKLGDRPNALENYRRSLALRENTPPLAEISDLS